MRRWALMSLFLLCIAVNLTSAQAIFADDPIILTLHGDLWAWSGPDRALTQLTDWGYNREPMLSPDSTRVAYASFASVFVDWLATVPGAGGFLPPANIWILDLPTSQTYRIAEQPPDAQWAGPAAAGIYTLRTTPSWSPDGTELAWMEFLVNLDSFAGDRQTGTAQLVTYNLLRGSSRVLDSFPVVLPGSLVSYIWVNWSSSGILVSQAAQYSDSPAWRHRVYDSEGSLLAEAPFEEDVYRLWVRFQGQNYLFDSSQHARDGIFNWQTNRLEPFTGTLQLSNPNVGNSVRFSWINETWHLQIAAETINLGEAVTPIGIARDGMSALYRKREAVPQQADTYMYTFIIHTPDEIIELGDLGTLNIVWGVSAWEIN